MLHRFIEENRDAIIAHTNVRLLARNGPVHGGPAQPLLGIPIFLDQLGEALQRAKSTDTVDHRDIGTSAALHGEDLLRRGLTIGQVVHDYGDVCQAITDMASQSETLLSAEEFQILNLCLDDAIAGAVTSYSRQRERAIVRQGTEQLGVLAHELRNLLNTAMLSFEGIQGGQVAPNGSTGALHARTLVGLRDLIDRSLAGVRLDAGIDRRDSISVAELVEEVEIGAMVQARPRGVAFVVTSVDRTVTVVGDRQILAAAVSNLLQNAIKFTRKQGKVSLSVHTTAERVLFDIEDECGGLPPGKVDDLFHPFEQRNEDRSGLGLGLTICLKAAQSNGGSLRVRDLPGKGCVFTLDLPRTPPPPLVGVPGGRQGPPASSSESTDLRGEPGQAAPKAEQA